jgi:hypothetical protein
MSIEVAGRERRRFSVRAPITGLVLVLIVVFGTYYGWQAAFGTDGTPSASVDCDSTTPTSTTTPPTTPGTTTSTTSTAVIPAAVQSTLPPTTTAPPTTGVLLPGDVTVNVLNSTDVRGIANNTAAVLRERGFDISFVGNDELDAIIPEVAHIRAARADMPEVQLLIQHIPGALVVADGRTDDTVDLVIGEAFVALGDPATVTPVPIATPRC